MNSMFVAAFFIGFLLKVARDRKKANVNALFLLFYYQYGQKFFHRCKIKNKKFPEKKSWGIRFNKVVKLLI